MASKLFANVEKIVPPKGLETAIIRRINEHKKRSAKIRLWCVSTLGVLSAVALVPAFQYFTKSLAQSGFNQYLSLLFSDSAVAVSYWRELLLSLAESLPALDIISVLGLFVILLSSVRYILKDAKIIFRNYKFI